MKEFLIKPLRSLRGAALAFFGLALLGAPALAEAPSGAAGAGSTFWTMERGAPGSAATPLGDLTLQGTVEEVHRRGRRWRRGLFLRPGFYRRGWHGRRYRYRRGPYRYRYHGCWYRRPWWLVTGYDRRYPRRAYYYQRYEYGGGRCDYWAGQCARNWGRRNNNFYGCLRYHGCR